MVEVCFDSWNMAIIKLVSPNDVDDDGTVEDDGNISSSNSTRVGQPMSYLNITSYKCTDLDHELAPLAVFPIYASYSG